MYSWHLHHTLVEVIFGLSSKAKRSKMNAASFQTTQVKRCCSFISNELQCVSNSCKCRELLGTSQMDGGLQRDGQTSDVTRIMRDSTRARQSLEENFRLLWTTAQSMHSCRLTSSSSSHSSSNKPWQPASHRPLQVKLYIYISSLLESAPDAWSKTDFGA